MIKMNVKDENQALINQTSAVSAEEDNLSEKPLIVIESRRNSLNPKDLWRYRDLLLILTWRDIKVRYKQTALGILWALIQPLFLVGVFSFVFGKLAAIQSDGVPYLLFALAGLVPWTFFSNAVVASGNSLVGNSSLITKVYFPRMIIPLAAVGAGLVDLAILFALLTGLLIFYGVAFSPNILLLPVLVLLTFFFSRRSWNVDGGNQRQIPRCASRFAVFRANLDVCHADYLSAQSDTGRLALAVFVKPINRIN
ncbi:MAG: ABC transporter permease [Blastocatellia bacterium]|nr:ABC transporter permease [Blastocatellia bacterium]